MANTKTRISIFLNALWIVSEEVRTQGKEQTLTQSYTSLKRCVFKCFWVERAESVQ